MSALERIITHTSSFQENQDKLHREIDQYQHELTALQSSYSQKISALNKKHKQELQEWQDEKEEYEQRIEELEERLLNPEQHGMLLSFLFRTRNLTLAMLKES